MRPEGGQGVGEVGGTLLKQQLGGGAGLGEWELVHIPGTGGMDWNWDLMETSIYTVLLVIDILSIKREYHTNEMF